MPIGLQAGPVRAVRRRRYGVRDGEGWRGGEAAAAAGREGHPAYRRRRDRDVGFVYAGADIEGSAASGRPPGARLAG